MKLSARSPSAFHEYSILHKGVKSSLTVAIGETSSLLSGCSSSRGKDAGESDEKKLGRDHLDWLFVCCSWYGELIDQAVHS